MKVFDVAKLVAEIKAVSKQIQGVKGPLRATWTKPMGAAQWELVCLKRRATKLCALRAHTRGRVHSQGASLETQAELVAALIPEFELEVAGAVEIPEDAPAAGGATPPTGAVAVRNERIVRLEGVAKLVWTAAARG